MNNSSPNTTILQSIAYRLIILAFAIIILIYAKSVLLPLVLASIFALSLMAPVRFLEKKGIPKSLSAAICLILALILVTGVCTFIASQILKFEKDFPALETKFIQLIIDIQYFIMNNLHVSSNVVEEYLNPLLNNAVGMVPTIIGDLVGFFSNSLFIAGFTIIYTFLILIYRKNIAAFLNTSFKHLEGNSIQNITIQTQTVIKGYINGLLLEMLFVAGMLSIGFSIVGVKYAILLAVISAIMNLVPYLGFISAAIISVIITFATNSTSDALWVGVISLIVHLIDSNIFLPTVVGSKVKINALATVVGVFIGNLIWGIPGMFLAVPIVAIIKVFSDEIPALSHWGILLGDREKPIIQQNSTKNKFKKDK